MNFTLFSDSEARTFLLGELLGSVMRGGLTLLLEGELGTGKTLFVRGLGSALGVRHVRSPSFTLVNEYRTRRLTLVHADLYRLDPDGVDDLGLEDFLNDDELLLVVEWPDRWRDALAFEALHLCLRARSEEVREIEGSARGERVERIARDFLDVVRRECPEALREVRG